MDNSLQKVIGQLEELFQIFNTKFFEGKLETPVIAVNADHTGGAFGWFTCYRAWVKEGSDGFYEINVTAEYLNRPLHEVCATLLHEMVHLGNFMDGVKDVSRGATYHNKKFKTTAEAHGLIIEHTEKYGWTKTSLQDFTKDFIDSLQLSPFAIHRQKQLVAQKTGGKKSSSRKYVCPICGTSIRATKEVRISCIDCDEVMVEENTGDEDDG